MLELTGPAEDLDAIFSLYARAFPPEERPPLEPLLRDSTGHARVLSARDGGRFCGFVCLLAWGDIVHIIYFAVEESLRGRGLGGQILEEVRRAYPGRRIIADIELPEDGAENQEQRLKRKAFYLRCGYRENGFRYRWQGTSYTVLSQGGGITEDEFWQFWDRLEGEMPEAKNY